ncbi:hypothetical protein [Streptomyces chattanoogensis]|uniref:hypothetical protein n=1 Tax=Streptomyces chattanoogensis TaxID=66876 RepID=UPI0036B683EF
MGGSGEYKVDLDAMDQVIKELNQVLKNMGDANSKAKNSTFLAQGTLGHGFAESDQLYQAHAKMQHKIQNLLKLVEDLVDKHGKKSAKVRGAYQDAEADNTISMK